jgi:hypothetical protein
MSKREWFFKRGNARLSWETLPEWVQWVAVDRSGKGYGYQEKPVPEVPLGQWELEKSCKYGEIAYTAEICNDWQSLIFERPSLVHKLLADTFKDLSMSFEVRTPCKPVQDKNFTIKVTCACGEEILIDDEPIFGAWAKRSYIIPCPNCHASLRIRVKYESAN